MAHIPSPLLYLFEMNPVRTQETFVRHLSADGIQDFQQLIDNRKLSEF